MEANRFDTITRSLTAVLSRRGLGGGGLAALVGWRLAPHEVRAKKKHSKKRKKKKTKSQPPPVVNAFGCVDVGQACRGDSTFCCSGICQGAPPQAGQPDTSVCVAHNSGICTVNTDSCAVGVSVSCHPSNESCYCTMTTGNAPFCGDFTTTSGPAALCRVCGKDSDCEAEFGLGAACVLLGDACTAICPATGRTACVPPCA